MTGCDLIFLVPWVAFGVGLAVVVFRLRPLRHRPTRPQTRRRDGGDLR